MRKFTKLAFKLHGWLGLAGGFFFLLFGLTGSMLLFRHELDRAFNPEVHRLVPGDRQVSADSMYRMINRTHPNLKKIVLHDFPVDRYDSYEFMVYKNRQQVTENYLYYVAVNPYTGKIIREGNYQDIGPSFFRWLYSFHYSLQLGIPGELFSAIIGLVMLLSLVSGLIVYRKHLWDALRFKAGLNFKNGRTAISSLHRIVGVWAMLSTAVFFFTGFWMNKEHFAPSEWKLNPPHQNIEVKVDIDTLVKRSQKIVPGFLPIAVNIPSTPGQDVVVRGRMPTTSFFLLQGKASGISFDPVTGVMKKVSDIDKQDFDTRFDAEVYSLHIGSYGGIPIRCLYVILGLLPGILSVTGAILWFKRTRKKR